MRLTLWILSRLIPNHADTENIDVRVRMGLLEGWISVVTNTALFFIKGALGYMTGSVALIADAIHTLSDSLTSVVVIFGFSMAKKPADEKHPFGHGRMESIAAVIIAVLLAVVAFEMFRAALDRLIHPEPVHAENWVIIVLIATIAFKELLARFSFDLGKLIGSQALTADGWHHRSDVLATGLVVVAFFGVHWNLNWLDGAMGIGVAAMIGWAAFETLSGAVGPLLGEAAPESMYREIAKIAHSVPGVQGVHDILVNRYGFLNIISLHIEVPSTESAMRLHDMSDEVETLVRQRFGGHAIVHVDPLNTDHAHYEEVRKIIADAVAEEKDLVSFHDLRLVGGMKRFKVLFDVARKPGAGSVSTDDFRERALARLRERFPRVRISVDVEPLYFHNIAESTQPAADGKPASEANAPAPPADRQ